MDFSEFLKKSGGMRQISYDLDISPSSIHQWKWAGIPDKYWDYLIKVSGLTLEQLYKFNKKLEKDLRAKKDGK